jgi:hypothetical protein
LKGTQGPGSLAASSSTEENRMAKLSVGDKVTRVLKFFLGLRNKRTVAALAAHGFSDEDLAEGWSLLQKVTRTKLDNVPVSVPTGDPVALELLDEWENKWFPIAAATLQRRAPEAHAWLFRNLVQTEGAAVIVSVGTFVERFALLSKAKKDGGYGPGGSDAKKILEKRGLSAKVIDEAKDLLKRLQTEAPSNEPVPDEEQAEEEAALYAKAEADLWAWYLEWSVIARKTVKNRNLLRQLGFLKVGAAGKEEEVAEEEVSLGAPDGTAPEEAKKPKGG